MDFFVLSLPEATFLYLGLAVQALLRQTVSGYVVPIVLLWTFVLLWRAAGGPLTAYKLPIGYFVASLVLCILFWPESTIFGRLVGQTIAPEQVASYAASQDSQATIVTAADTGQVPAVLADPVVVTPGFRLLLRPLLATPLTLARMINSQSHRTFSSLMPMNWLLGIDLTADVTSAIADWTHNCYLPVHTGTMEAAQGRTVEDLLPWGNSALRQGLTTRTVIPGSQTGITWLRGPEADNSVRCDTYLDAVEFRTQAWLFELKSPRGTPLLEVFQQELGLDSQQQARFLVYREMLRAAGPAVPPPSLAGMYAGLRAGGMATQAVGGTVSGAALGWLSGAFSWGAALVSGGKAVGAGLTTEFQRVIDGMSWFVGLAVLLTWFAPYILGLMHLVLLGLFPFVLLWALIPGTQFLPLASYFVALLFVSSAPLWWAIVDLAQRLAGSQAPQSSDLILGLGNSLTPFIWSTAITVLGIFLVPLLVGMVLFLVFRSIGSLWRGVV